MRKVLALMIVLSLVLMGCGKSQNSVTIESKNKADGSSFIDLGKEICAIDKKPIIRLYATSWCPHCRWVKDTFKEVMKEYTDQDKIVAHLYEVDTNDDLLTPEKDSIPQEELDIFKEFNKKESIPTYIMGCKYKRVGNAFEAVNDLGAEAAEFRIIIDKLIDKVNNPDQKNQEDQKETKKEAGQQTNESQTISPESIKEFTMTLEQFKFTPGNITVKKGDKVRITLISLDVPHSFTISDLHVSSGPVAKDSQKVVEFTADKAGTFKFFCSVYCGSGHSSMSGDLIVEP